MRFDLRRLAAIREKVLLARDTALAKANEATADGEKTVASRHTRTAARMEEYAATLQDASTEIEMLRRKVAEESKSPTSEEARFVAALFRRREATEWEDKEIKAFKRLVRKKAMTMESLLLVKAYYDAERAKGEQGRQRRDLSTFLNNFSGEVDRAAAWKNRARPRMSDSNPGQEPAGFREWLKQAYPDADQSIRWDRVPDNIKREFDSR